MNIYLVTVNNQKTNIEVYHWSQGIETGKERRVVMIFII